MQVVSRRDFVKAAGCGAASFAVAGLAQTPTEPIRTGRIIPPGRKLSIACIGIGGKGSSDVRGVGGENIVALCDVDFRKGRDSFKRFPDAVRYRDYRKMLLEMDDQIDAVTVTTPDHTHFPAAMMAVQMGKHVFCQKPMTHTIWGARQLQLAARRHKVATQMGIQGHTGEGIRLLREWIEADAIGPVREVHLWTNRPIWPQGIARPTDTPPVPASMDWNLWLGTAPERPYNPAYAPFKWRGWWDFGCGALGDIGCHSMDAAFWALRLTSPTSVEAESSSVNDETAPKWSKIVYEFPARGNLPPVTVYWYDGDKKPPRPKDLEADRKLPGGIGGQLYVGEKGTIMTNDVYCNSPRIIPEAKMRDFLPKRPEKTIPRSPGVYQEWIRACKGGEPAGANFPDYAGPLTEMVLLGNLAIRTGQKVEWDAENLVCTNVPAANQYVRQPYRRF